MRIHNYELNSIQMLSKKSPKIIMDGKLKSENFDFFRENLVMTSGKEA